MSRYTSPDGAEMSVTVMWGTVCIETTYHPRKMRVMIELRKDEVEDLIRDLQQLAGVAPTVEPEFVSLTPQPVVEGKRSAFN